MSVSPPSTVLEGCGLPEKKCLNLELLLLGHEVSLLSKCMTAPTHALASLLCRHVYRSTNCIRCVYCE